MKLSVVIPAFNEERLLGETLRHVQAGLGELARRGWDTELIVCDNNSTDRTAAIAREGGAQVVFEPINQIGRARNTGAAAAGGDWLLFIDADSHAPVELFLEVAAEIQSGRCLAGGSIVRVDEKCAWGQFGIRVWNCLSRTLHLLAGSFIFCDAAVFKRVGGFNPELFASEELDLCKRLKQVAREQMKRIVILHRHPLVTSGRKFHLYTVREHLWFLARTVATFGRTLTSREACHTWYDGRR